MARSSLFRSAVTVATLLLTFITYAGAFEGVSFGSVGDFALSELDLKVRDSDLFVGPHAETIDELSADEAPPHTHQHQKRVGSGAPYWISQIKRQGKSPYAGNTSFVIWRNVKDYGAKGDGVTDDTAAINLAGSIGDRCGLGCDSRLSEAAIVYFPAGVYRLSSPAVMYYHTSYIGDANNLPTLKALPSFDAIGVIDANVYLPYGFNWYQNQNNMWRQVRNFIIDITEVPPNRPVHGIHWQVAQATSLQNIVFNMAPARPGDGSQQHGIFMDNGSGGWLEDLIFNDGAVGLFAGNQQFTVVNMTFNRCNTAIFQNWNWVFLYKDIEINNCGVGLDMSQGGDIPATGSVILLDAVIRNTKFGVITSFGGNSTPTAAGTLVLDNVDFVNTNPAISYRNGTVIAAGNRKIDSFVQGRVYSAYESSYEENNITCYGPAARAARIQQQTGPPPKPQVLLDARNRYYLRSKPQYEGTPVEKFKSAMDFGCSGDGFTDQTVCVQNFLNSIRPDEIAYFDHGSYIITDTINCPINIKIVGEMWAIIMVMNTEEKNAFGDIDNPQVAWRVGRPGEKGTVEMTDMLFETRGPTPGAIIMEWNLAGTTPGATGMWDTHFLIGGTNGTMLQSNNCRKTPSRAHGADPKCYCAFLLLHLTTTSSLIMSNNWGWVADHEMDLEDHEQIDIYNGRGLLVESQGPTWIYGSSFEHSMLYNYNFANAKDVFVGLIQSETA